MKDISKYCQKAAVAGVLAVSLATAAASSLPSTVCFSVANPGSSGVPSYFDTSIAGIHGIFDTWCVTPDTQIVYGKTYTGLILTPAEAAGLVLNPANLDLVAYIINKDYPPEYTSGDIQVAIWLLIDDSISVDQGPWSQDHVDQIIADAVLNGEGFVPQCGDRDIAVLVPVATGCSPNTTATTPIAQVLILEIPVPCDSPGTGTPGYWGQYWRAWPVEEITIGGITYSKEEAVTIIQNPVRNDKRYTMFPALVAAKLNVIIGNDDSCIADTIAEADAWWAAFNANPVAGSSTAWKMGEPLYWMLDAYNNGKLCAPARD